MTTPADQTDSVLPRSQQLFVIGILSLTFGLLLIHWLRLQNWGTQEVTINRPEERLYDYQLDINQAGKIEWMQLEGIGDRKAEAILLERETNGPFESIEDMLRVEGIGPKTLAKLRPWLRFSEPISSEEPHKQE